MLHVAAGALTAATLTAGFGGPATTASALPLSLTACASPPVMSPHGFTGVVTDVTDDGRTATVRTDDGRTVTVIGTQGTGTDDATARTFEAGLRYEFHPLNDASPYRDDPCTATRAIGSEARPSVPPVGPGSPLAVTANADSRKAAEDEDSPWPGGWLSLGAIALALVTAALVTPRLRRQPRTDPER
jgi:hypothetical protein